MTQLDYGSAVLAGLPSHLLNRLQSVLNVLCVALASTITSLICSRTCIGYGFRKEYSSDWPYWLSAVVTTRRLRISLTSPIGLTRPNHGIDYGPVPVHA